MYILYNINYLIGSEFKTAQFVYFFFDNFANTFVVLKQLVSQKNNTFCGKV